MIAAIVRRARDDQSSLDEQHAAFGELVRRFSAMAFSVALRTLDDVDEAHDATQEAFLTAWLKLRTLREPAAFGTWLKQLVRTQCSRRIRKREAASADRPFVDAADARERRRLIARSMTSLTAAWTPAHELISLETIRADVLIEDALPNAFRELRTRPDLIVRIERRDDRLISIGGGQCHVLASINDEQLITEAYDGEGRFRRDRSGRVTDFIYYEFGKRLGIAKKMATPGDRI